MSSSTIIGKDGSKGTKKDQTAKANDKKTKNGSKEIKEDKGKSSTVKPKTSDGAANEKHSQKGAASKTYCLGDGDRLLPTTVSPIIKDKLEKCDPGKSLNDQAATFIIKSLKDNLKTDLNRDELDTIAAIAGTDVLEKYKNDKKVFKTKDGQELRISDLLDKQNEMKKKTVSEADQSNNMTSKTQEPDYTSTEEKPRTNPDPEHKLEREISDLEKKCNDREIELKEKEEELEQLRKENNALKEKDHENESEMKSVCESYDKMVNDQKSENDDKRRIIDYLKKDLEKTNGVIQKLEDEKKVLATSLNESKHDLIKEKRNVHYLNEKYETDIRHKNEQIKELVAERDDLRHRFSKLAGAKLTDQNPDIADLSDPNRAMKISEKFGQLYDDQWTDAFEYLKGKKKMSVKDSVALLLEILQKCEKFCTDMKETQMDSLRNVLLHPAQDVSAFGSEPRKHVGGFREHERIKSEDKKAIMELRRQIGVNDGVLEEVKQIFVSQSKSWPEKKSLEGCTTYLQKCAEVCWLMVLHDPPLYMKFDAQHGDRLDLNLYTVYSSSGKLIDFLVWPPLFNEKGGGLMSKGTAEPTRTVKKT